MELLNKAKIQIRNRIWFVAATLQIFAGITCILLIDANMLNLIEAGMFIIILGLAFGFLVGWVAGHDAEIPLKALGNAILHVSPSQNPSSAPQTINLEIGQEYVTSIAYQLYQIASMQDNKLLAEHKREATQASNILTHLPLPLFVFNNQQIITFASDSALSYSAKSSSEMFGKTLFDVMDFEFPSNFTLENWIKDCATNKATDTAYWRRVRLNLKGDKTTIRQCDIAGYYNRDNPKGIEYIITLFDRTQEYESDDQSLSFIALAVHELRSPLTLVRGLIEVFEDELDGKLNDELKTYINRMQSSTAQLTRFINTILNVAKIEQNQLTIKLSEEQLDKIINHVLEDISFKTKNLGITINYKHDETIPSVAADNLMIYEVITNIIDNAIKYSGSSKEIELEVTLNKDDMVQINIIDHGIGIPTAVIPSLFEKFHRNHRNNNNISGTGLGLYLAKAIVNAHGGNIWISSKENEGTTAGFTLKPYRLLASEQKTSNNDAMVRTAHGWIKNHSIYRK